MVTQSLPAGVAGHQAPGIKEMLGTYNFPQPLLQPPENTPFSIMDFP